MVIASLQTNTAIINLSKGEVMYTVSTKVNGGTSKIRYKKEYEARKSYLRLVEHYIRLGGN